MATDLHFRLHAHGKAFLCCSPHDYYWKLTERQFNDFVFLPGTYRIVALPCNYKLLCEAFTRLEQLGAPTSLLVGAPSILKPGQDGFRLIHSLYLLEVHDNVSNKWHRMDKSLFLNYVLLHLVHKKCEDYQKVFKGHILKPVFDFMDSADLSSFVQVLASIVDPRWYIGSGKRDRLVALNHRFGLTSECVRRHWQNKRLDKRFANLPHLVNVVKSLDRNGWLLQDLETGIDGPNMMLKACRRVLAFIARNWLNCLTGLPYFDPAVFFKQAEAVETYRQRFSKG